MAREEFHSIHHPIAIDRGLGQVTDEEDYGRHVDQMVKQVLLTNPGERINRPDFGCGLRRMVFAPNSDASANLLKVTVMQSLDKWLGEVVKVDNLTITVENETLSVSLRYILVVRRERRYLNLQVAL